MFIINRCFKNIWLESQMIHVALFSFQRTTWASSFRTFKVLIGFSFYILSHPFPFVKNFFSTSEQKQWDQLPPHPSPVADDLYYDTRLFPSCQPPLWKKQRPLASDKKRRSCGQLLLLHGKNQSSILVMMRPSLVPDSRFHVHLIATVTFACAPANRMRWTNIHAHQAMNPVICGLIFVRLTTALPRPIVAMAPKSL